MSSCWHLWIQKISRVFLWKKVLPILSHLSFLSRTQSSLHHGFCATDKWRCVRAVYQPSKSSLNSALIPQITQRSFWRPLTWRPLWWAPCLLQTGWQSSLPLLSSLYSSVFCTAGCFPLELLASSKMISFAAWLQSKHWQVYAVMLHLHLKPTASSSNMFLTSTYSQVSTRHTLPAKLLRMLHCTLLFAAADSSSPSVWMRSARSVVLQSVVHDIHSSELGQSQSEYLKINFSLHLLIQWRCVPPQIWAFSFDINRRV